MKKVIKYLIIALLVIITILLIFIIINNKKNNNNSNYEDEFKEYKQEYTEQKKKYGCNEFRVINMSTDELVKIYFNKYKNMALDEPESAFNMLDKEYKEKKFKNVEEYKAYVLNNRELIYGSTLNGYQAEKDGNSTRYICIDNNGQYYIFIENAIMDYDVILDTYTIDLPEFTEKYEKATEQQKVALNIDKFIQSINNKDYIYAYNCLADSFKNNYFKTQVEFENYVKSNFYENSTITYNNFETQGNLFTYSITLTNKNTNEKMSKTFIMQLGDETEFVLSFDR